MLSQRNLKASTEGAVPGVPIGILSSRILFCLQCVRADFLTSAA